jgi:hypothetical protein
MRLVLALSKPSRTRIGQAGQCLAGDLSHTYVVDRIFAAHMMRKSAEGVAERVAVESGDITKLPFADAVHC